MPARNREGRRFCSKCGAALVVACPSCGFSNEPGVVPVRSRLPATAARGLTRFVGRDPEMERLRVALDRTKEGHGQGVALVGEAGAGKSRLAARGGAEGRLRR